MSVASLQHLFGDSPVRPVRNRPAAGGWQATALMLGIFLLPFVVTWLLFVVPWRSDAKPRGELVASTHPLLTLPTTAAASVPHWLLVQTASPSCMGDCALTLADVSRRIHVALYKDMPRVQRVWLADDAADSPANVTLASRLTDRFPDLVLIHDPKFSTHTAAPALYVVDPSGRPVLRYGQDADPRDVLNDLKRLLKTSWLG